nr:restriction endonuclease subunit S [uncultured Carboxylicivirga sp.]
MSEWRQVKLGDVIQLSTTKVESKKILLERYISTDNLLPNLGGIELAKSLPKQPKYTSFQKGDVLFSNIRTYFKKVWKADFDGGCSNDVLVFKSIDNNEVDQAFVYYVISNSVFVDYTAFTAKGTKMPRGDKEAIKNYSLLLPGITEQIEIAKTLSNLDKKITLLRQQNQDLEELAQTLFKRWFVEFEFPNENGEPYKSSGGKMVESELGEIPEGWRLGSLDEFSTLKSGYAFKSNDFVDNSLVKAIKIKDLKGKGIVEISDASSVSEHVTIIDRVKYFKLEEGDIVLAMSGNTTGKIGIIPPHENELYLNQRVGKFFLKESSYKSFVYNFLMSGNYEERILSMGYGSAQPNINPGQIESIEVLIPSEKLLTDYIKISEPIFNKVLVNNEEIQSLTQLRDTLLPKLMSGELRVNEY